MKIFTISHFKKILIYATALLMVSVLSIGIASFGKYVEQGKVDKSTALQVVKPLPAEEVIPVISPDFFTEYRLERERIRSERSELLREAIRAANSEEARQKAQENIFKIISEKQQETEIENLIKAKGFTDALVFIRDNSVSAVVKTTSLSRDEVMIIADIVSKVCGVKGEDITISAKP